MKTTTSKILAILLFITTVTGGIFYKQFYDSKNELKKSMDKTGQLENQVQVSQKISENTELLLNEAQNAIVLQKKEALKSIAQLEGSIKELEGKIFLLKGKLENEKEQHELQVTKLTSIISSLETGLDQIKKHHSNDLEKIIQLEKQLKSGTDQVEMLNQEVIDFKKELSSKEVKLKNANKMIQIKQEEIARRVDIANTLEQAGEKSEELLEARQGIISNLQDELSSLKEDVFILSGKLEAQIEASDNKNALLENINSQNREKIQSFEKAIDLKSEQLAQMAKELKTIQFLRKDETQKNRDQISFLEKKMGQKISITEKEITALKLQVSEGMTIKKRATQLEKEKAEALIRAQTLKKTYNNLMENLKHELASKDATIKEFEKKLTLTFVDRILFDFGRASLNPEGKLTLQRTGQALKDSPGSKLQIIGHTDDVPIAEGFRYKFPSNWELSASRASSVARFLHKYSSIEPEKMEVVGRSFYHPMSDNTTQGGRAKNRRVEIVIIPE